MRLEPFRWGQPRAFWLLAALAALAAPARSAAAPGTGANGANGATGSNSLTAPVKAHLQWLRQSADNEGAPFVVIDKQDARLWLFDARGDALGETAVLLGLAHGDVSTAGIGERAIAAILPSERTTPAGRFIAEAGRNAGGEDIIWVDYDAAVSMHRLRASNPAEQRQQRLSTPSPADNRISYGCINVPAAFYDGKIVPAFAQHRGVVYILPETLPASMLFTPSAQRPGHPDKVPGP